MVDLSELQKGYKVKFRCGGEAIVEYFNYDKLISDGEPNGILFEGESGEADIVYGRETGCSRGGKNHPCDIILIIPPECDWNDVKPGMAFERSLKGVPTDYDSIWYVGNTPSGLMAFEYSDGNGNYKLTNFERHHLIRAPNDDLPTP